MDKLTLRTLTAETAAANVGLTRNYYKSDSKVESTRAQIITIYIPKCIEHCNSAV